MARHKVAGFYFPQLRLFSGASFHALRAAARKAAARRGVYGAWHVAFQQYALRLNVKPGDRHGGKQRLGIRMNRIFEQLFAVRKLNHASKVHYRYAVGNMFNNAQVMGYEQIRQSSVLLQLLHKIEHLCLNGYVQRRYRLIQHKELRIERKRPCYAHALAAAAAAIALGIPARDAAAALSASRGVRGRCEVLYHGAFTILCDYAHTGDAIEKVLAGVAPFVEGRLVVLYGCAGERDAKKRPLMSEAVVKYADFAVLTSDNPRKEDPCAIIKDAEPVLAASGKPYIVEVERRTAVNRALDMLRPGDVLALCGKGHEDYQVIDGVTLYLDEHRIVREWLERKGLDKA